MAIAFGGWIMWQEIVLSMDHQWRFEKLEEVHLIKDWLIEVGQWLDENGKFQCYQAIIKRPDVIVDANFGTLRGFFVPVTFKTIEEARASAYGYYAALKYLPGFPDTRIIDEQIDKYRQDKGLLP
jgi:hypothetical protein